ncbi:MAG TPA: 30S ribosomal protein S1 [Candidatus Moranbacteria bacterium]|nr:30S ribosomal protein S1 [Candidatus Moranbacteria bacterium]HAT75163.1 30S ribosomal protein S1 [Candidatus Moranbacteria bacterium]
MAISFFNNFFIKKKFFYTENRRHLIIKRFGADRKKFNQMGDILENLATEVDKLADKQGITLNATSDNVQKTAVPTSTPVIMEEKKNSFMEKLMQENPVNFPSIGDNIIGTVIEVSSSEIYLDLGHFGAGLVLGKEIKDGMGSNKLKVGDKVSAAVIDLENEEGFIELSIREASYEKAWEDIERKRDAQEKIKTKVISANKGGLLVEINGIAGFLPVSQLSSKNYPRVEDGDKNKILNLLKKLIGNELEVCILDVDREAEKLIASEKAAQSDKDKEAISSFKIGDIISGEISGVVDFGAFVKFSSGNKEKRNNEKEKIEGLVHISELAWQLIENPRTIVKVGDKVDAKIIGIDNDKISLSIRELQADPWSEATNKYKVGDVVIGKVHKINHFGAFVYLDKDIHGLAHISEMLNMNPGKSVNDLIKVDEDYKWKILSIESQSHRMGLVLADEKEHKTEKTEKKKAKKIATEEPKKEETKKKKKIAAKKTEKTAK